MCYGTCHYENWQGECDYFWSFPEDGACMMDEVIEYGPEGFDDEAEEDE